MTRKLIEANDLSNGQDSVNKNIRFKIDLLDDAANENYKTEKDITFKNDAPFRSCISKINNIFIDNAEDPDIVIPMYNLLECSDNYSTA